MKSEVVTLVMEYNYAEGQNSIGTVWAYCGDGRSDFEKAECLRDLPGWICIIGPINYETAARAHGALRLLFEQMGIQVIDEGIAD